MKARKICAWSIMVAVMVLNGSSLSAQVPNVADYSNPPLFLTAEVPPLVMLVMGRDHKLYYEAYNDASDLDGDGVLDVGYNPDIDYYGYFDCYKCYTYSSADQRFEPVTVTNDKKCVGNWSGDFLNYLSMSRIDTLRKVLYGGKRSTDSTTQTVLERSFLPQDGHSWGKEYKSIAYDGYDIADYAPLSQPPGGTRHLFANTSLATGGAPLLRVLENSIYRIWEWVSIERPVAGARALHGGSGPQVINNNTSGDPVDVTNGGTAGTASDNAVGGVTVTADTFDDAALDPIWTTADHDGAAGTVMQTDGGQLVISAAGADVWTGSDQFAAVYLDNVTGNFDVRVKVTQQQRRNGWGKTGIMVRNDMTLPGSSAGYLFMGVTPDNGFSFQWDNDGNGYLDSNVTNTAVTLPAWVRLTKVGTTFTGYRSTDGLTWTTHATRTIATALTDQDVGLFVTSHSSGNLSECRFDDFYLEQNPNASPDFAFDDNLSTKWLIADEPSLGDPACIQFQFGEAKRVLKYTITTANDAEGRDPKGWVLLASNSPPLWTTIDTVVNGALPVARGAKAEFECATPPGDNETYTYYALCFHETKDAGVPGVQVAEIEMLESVDPIPAFATLTDHVVRVQVGVAAMPESNCKRYGEGASAVYKPIGLLQRHGETDRMYFGLITGSYAKNTSGGVLRKGVGSISDEIDPDTGQFTSVNGIIRTIDALRVVGFDYGSYSYNQNCGWITTRPINEAECRMWGNPIGEMMYEALRYFGGKGAGTADFLYSTGDDVSLGLPLAAWDDPYDSATGHGSCAKPVMLVLSDINPSFDSDQMPGSAFSSFSATLEDHSGGSDFDAQALADIIGTEEGIGGTYFIGQHDSDYDGACTEKTVSSLGEVRGLCPEEPTKQGSYYSAAAAYFGRSADLSVASENQKVLTYAVALSSPLPRIEIPFQGGMVTLVPFAKSVAGSSINRNRGSFQPTNTIVDFYVQTISPSYGRFRINFEDVEQGADHDMDAIVIYEYQLVDADGNPTDDPAQAASVDITLTSEYAAGSIAQHMGYIISGTTGDGIYLEVRDCDTANPGSSGCVCCGNNPSTDPDYFLDTPPGVGPNQGAADTAWNDGVPLPLQASRRFTPSTGGGDTPAQLLENPLWYAAKWGGFDDKNNNNIPDLPEEWDTVGDGVPDNYYLVVNPLKLEQELNRSFADILKRTSSGTSVSVLATKGEGEGTLVQAYFKPRVTGPAALYDVLWVGFLQSLWVDRYGNIREDSNQNYQLDIDQDAIIKFFLEEDETRFYRYPVSAEDPYAKSVVDPASYPLDDLLPIWEAGDLLARMPHSLRNIFTYVGDGTEENPDVNKVAFTEDNMALLQDFLDVEDADAWEYLGTSPADRATNLVRFVRGIEDDSPPSTYNYVPGHEIRPRQLELKDATVRTWKLGDIVHSTPLSLSKPTGNYGLLYDDDTYRNFFLRYRNRETIVYVGSNDGMLHAFTSGVYKPGEQKFYSIHEYGASYDLIGIPDTLGIGNVELGSELWSYIPQCLLPHLKFLPDRDYPHVSFVDLTPKVLDAKVFTPDSAHPNGWGTILIGGLNMGGKEIATTGAGTFSPSFFAIDVTNPRNPRLMWEKSFPDMGFASNEPGVMKVEDSWYLVIGSGPTDFDGSSDQTGSVFIVDLASGALLQTFAAHDANSSMNAPVTFDKGLNYSVDAIYVGSTYRSGAELKGRAYRVTVPQTGTDFNPGLDAEYIADPTDANWSMVKLFDSPRPLTAPFAVSVDKKNNSWIFFGSGRYVAAADKTSTDQNYIFGLKDPFFNPDNNTACFGKYPAVECELGLSDLFESDLFTGEIHAGGAIDPVDIGGETIDTFSEMLQEARTATYRGWYRSLCIGHTGPDGTCYASGPSERVINKPSVLGGIVLVPTFSPNEDVCGFGGNGRLFALFYETGTAYKRRVIGERSLQDEPSEVILDVIGLGEGLSSSFGIHVGKEEGGTLYGQLSTGEIVQIDITPAFDPKSAPIYWREVP